MEDSSLNASDKLVYVTLSMFANNETGRCFPSIKKIANKSKFSPRTVKYSIKKLESKGYIKINNRFNENEQSTNEYIIIN